MPFDRESRDCILHSVQRPRALNRSSLSDTLLATSTQTPQELASLNRDVRHLRDAIYSKIGGWDAPA